MFSIQNFTFHLTVVSLSEITVAQKKSMNNAYFSPHEFLKNFSYF